MKKTAGGGFWVAWGCWERGREWAVVGGGREGGGDGEGRGREEKRLLLERALLRQWEKTDSAPAGADTAAEVGKYR